MAEQYNRHHNNNCLDLEDDEATPHDGDDVGDLAPREPQPTRGHVAVPPPHPPRGVVTSPRGGRLTALQQIFLCIYRNIFV